MLYSGNCINLSESIVSRAGFWWTATHLTTSARFLSYAAFLTTWWDSFTVWLAGWPNYIAPWQIGNQTRIPTGFHHCIPCLCRDLRMSFLIRHTQKQRTGLSACTDWLRYWQWECTIDWMRWMLLLHTWMTGLRVPC